MKAKLWVTLLLMLLSAIMFMMYSEGLFTRYNCFTAQWDKYRGHTQLVAYGERLIIAQQQKIIAGTKGFQIKTIAGCFIDANAVRGAEAYNKVMLKALNKKLGIGWRKSFDKSVDSLYRLQSGEVVRRAVMLNPDVARYIAHFDSILGKGKSWIDVDQLHDSVRKAYLIVWPRQRRPIIYKKYAVDIYTLGIREYIN